MSTSAAKWAFAAVALAAGVVLALKDDRELVDTYNALRTALGRSPDPPAPPS